MEVVTKDLRQSAAVPKFLRSACPRGGKYSSHFSGSVKAGISFSEIDHVTHQRQNFHTNFLLPASVVCKSSSRYRRISQL